MSQSLPTHGKCKVCIIQMEAVHEEIGPSLVKGLNDNSIIPDIYINADCNHRRGDLFREANGIQHNLFYVNLNNAKDWKNLELSIKNSDYDVCFFQLTKGKAQLTSL